jgi:hypothetical protein
MFGLSKLLLSLSLVVLIFSPSKELDFLPESSTASANAAVCR